jgi:predicted helicase
MTIQSYLDTLNLRFKTGISREHTYRGDLQTLLMTILPDILVTNEPARVACGAPDYVLTRRDVPVGYIEAKDIGIDLNAKILKDQFDRYKSGLSNLIFTDYLDFHFYKDAVFITSIAIAKIENGAIIPIPANFEVFEGLIKNFALTISQTIKSPTKLAEMMAGKAKLMADIIEKSLDFDDENDQRSSLKNQMLSFKQMLIHDIDNKAFSDIYAQTIAYGMFAARYHDPTLPTFSRQEAATLIPKSNPFLRKLFQDIAGYDLDDRLVWIVDELVNIFLATDVSDIMRNFGKSTKQEDPVVHFYETFLAAYNPALRKARGVWYTPQPVVNFIVRAVDDILKTEFDLPQGLADTSKIKVKSKQFTKATSDQRSKMKEVETEQEVHKVQILDPATGTGTFLAEVVKHIHKNFKGQQGIWSNYVSQHLIPRLNGFELLMASYAMAHLKMDMLLTETGYKATTDQRFKIFLTNSLEEAHPDTGTLFSSWLSDEADQANAVKRDTPVMVVMGNPPYSINTTNKSKWIEELISEYKKNLNERKLNLDDDYIKFIRFGQYFIDKNGSGILAYISNNSFIDGITHRKMRLHLLQSFDKIYILDLHGNSRKKELTLDGSVDQNVFDIMAGVSINLFIKTNKKEKNELGNVYQSDIYGKREFKYQQLSNNSLKDINWLSLSPESPNYFFVNKNFENFATYEKGFKIDEIFTIYNSGVKTDRDELFIDMDQNLLNDRFQRLLSSNFSEEFRIKYRIIDSGSFKITDRIKRRTYSINYLQKIQYRPFDYRHIYYDEKLVSRPGYLVMEHILKGDNLALISKRGQDFKSPPIFLTNSIADIRVYSCPGVQGSDYLFPLYSNPSSNGQSTIDKSTSRVPNLNKDIINDISNLLGITFEIEKKSNDDTFAPVDILDYIYAVLHSDSYQKKYKEFFKIDFPRVPYPTNQETFWKLVKLGGEIRQIHLLESPEVSEYITQYPIDGDNIVTKIKFELNYEIIDGDSTILMDPVYPMGRVYINDTQFFQMVPEVAWNFYIGGYQPAQKWLKDRKGRELSFEDILHYQKIIVALFKTDEIMKEIDLVGI